MVRELLRHDFDRVTLLADSSQVARTQAGGFDGIALFDNYVAPDVWPLHAQNCATRNLVFSFQVNPGFDSIVWPQDDPNTCYRAPAFAPGGGVYDWTRAADRAAAEAASRGRITQSFQTTVELQTRPGLTNARDGFFLVYINSFNEWHEGHQFEPSKNRADLTAAELSRRYHNGDQGNYRLQDAGIARQPCARGTESPLTTEVAETSSPRHTRNRSPASSFSTVPEIRDAGRGKSLITKITK